MKLHLLKTFLAVARLKSFSAAARELHTVQPAVSRQIAALESDLGVSLFWRSTREVKVTAAGEVLLREAAEILAHDARAEALVQRAAKGQVGRLRIGYMSSACATFIPGLVRRYAQSFPDVQLRLREMTAQQQLDAFAAGRLDIGFSRPLPDVERDAFITERIYIDTIKAVLPAEHPLAGAARIRLSDLRTESFVLFKRSEAVGLFDQIVSACVSEGFAPHITSQTESMQTLLTEVAAGLGVALAPGCVRHLYSAGCVLIPLDEQVLSIATELHYRAERLQPAVDAFVAQTLEARRDIQTQMQSI